MAVQTIYSSINLDAVAGGAWRANDSLTINDGAVVTVNTDQDKFLSGVTIANGKLRIENTSTTNAINFRLGRASGTGTVSISPSSGLGSVEVAGNWIEIGTSNGTANQVFNTPYRTFIPALWVETSAGSGVYESWANVQAPYGAMPRHEFTGMEGFGKGRRGMVFENVLSADSNKIIYLLNCSTTLNSRVVTIGNTTDITPGAHVTGSAAIPANSVVERVLNATQIEINANATATNSAVTCTIYPTLDQQFTNQVIFGDDVSGAIPPAGCKIRIPNIMISHVCGTNLFGDASYFRGGEIYLMNSGSCDIDTCLLTNINANFQQAQRVRLCRTGISYTMALSKCFDNYIDDVVFAHYPTYNLWTTSAPFRAIAFSQDHGTRSGNKVTIETATGTFKNIYIVANLLSNGSSEYGALILRYVKDATVQNLRVAATAGAHGAAVHALVLAYTTNCSVNGIESYGVGPINFNYANGNTVQNLTFGNSTLNESVNWLSSDNSTPYFQIDPNTNAPFIDGQRYYFKFVPWTMGMRGQTITATNAPDHLEFALTPHIGNPNSYRFFEVTPSATGTVVFNWARYDPTHNAPSYEIFRSTNPAVPVRDASTRIFTTNTAGTLTATDSTATAGTTYYYVFRKHMSAGVYYDSEIFEVTPKVRTVATNLLLQSQDPNNASWTKVSCTSVATANWAHPRNVLGYLVQNAAKTVTSSSTNATLTQAVSGLSIGQTYIAQIYVYRQPSFNAGVLSKTSPGRLTFGTAFVDFNYTDSWQAVSVTFTATATSHNFVLQINNTADQIVWGIAGVYLGSTLKPWVYTTTATANDSTAHPTLAGMMTRARYGYTKNAGVYFTHPSRAGYVTGTWHCSTTKGFTPTKQNMLALPTHRGGAVVRFANMSPNNRVSNITQSGFGGSCNAPILVEMFYSSSGNVIENATYNAGGMLRNPGGVLAALYCTLDANQNTFKNIEIKNWPVSASSYNPLVWVDNFCSGNTFQNIRGDFPDSPNNVLGHGTLVKGLQGGFDTDDDATSTPRWQLGISIEGVPNTLTTVYDTHFYEAYHSATTGAINLLFTPSTKASPPYTLTGTAKFDNTGKLYLQSAGDSVTYTWPHKIYGVSGFRNIAHKVISNQLTTNDGNTGDADQLVSLLLEFQIDTGAGYGDWAEATPAALSALSLSATTGFNLKLRLTARPFFRFISRTGTFIVGETVRLVSTGATARITSYRLYLDIGSATSGLCTVDNIVGSWNASGAIVRDSDSQARASFGNFSTYGYVLGPVPTSYIQGLQIHTNVDRTALYPADAIKLTIQGLPAGSDVVVLSAGTNTVLGSVDSNAGDSWQFNYTTPEMVDICVYRPGYIIQPIRNFMLSSADASVLVSSRIDLNYAA